MTTTSTPIAPEVRLFLAKVRAQLADLDPDEVREITDGLEADLGELVAERGPSSLGDPEEYAGELRLAAGLPTPTGGVAARPGLGARVSAVLDRAAAASARAAGRLPFETGPVIGWLRPTWWIVRGWTAAQLVAVVASQGFGLGGYHLGALVAVPHLRGAGWLLVLGATALSLAVGTGKVWPGRSRTWGARVVLLAINAVLGVGLLAAVSTWGDSSPASGAVYGRAYNDGYQDAAREIETPPYYASQAGVYSDGRWVSQIFPYDAEGRPLVGVQLFDQAGKAISVVTQPECDNTAGAEAPVLVGRSSGERLCVDESDGRELQSRIYYPWTNGAAQLYNVFPLVSRYQDAADPVATAFAEKDRPAVGTLPFATVPPISLPGITTSTVAKGKPASGGK
jgi:hypothetical protein